MGAVLTPQLIGIHDGAHLPNASSFCGRCQAVCPMNIPLPKMMRHWRERDFAQKPPASVAKAALRVWAYFVKRPALYRFASGLSVANLIASGGKKAPAVEASFYERLDTAQGSPGAGAADVHGAVGGAAVAS